LTVSYFIIKREGLQLFLGHTVQQLSQIAWYFLNTGFLDRPRQLRQRDIKQDDSESDIKLGVITIPVS